MSEPTSWFFPVFLKMTIERVNMYFYLNEFEYKLS